MNETYKLTMKARQPTASIGKRGVSARTRHSVSVFAFFENL